MTISDVFRILKNDAKTGRFSAFFRLCFFPVVALLGAFVIIPYAIAMFIAIFGDENEWKLGDRI